MFDKVPWIIGPVPIFLTVLCAYIYGKTIARKKVITSERLSAALLLPVGLFSILTQLFFAKYDFVYLLIINQMASSITCLLLSRLANSVSNNWLPRPKTKESFTGLFKATTISGMIFLSIDAAFIFIPHPNKCTIAKCYVLEAAIGAKTSIFSTVYSGSFLGSIFLFVAVAMSVEIIRKLFSISSAG
jgi:hypothetical protein